MAKKQEQEEVQTKRNASPAQTVKSFSQNITKLIELKLVNQEDGEKLKELQKKVVQQYLGFELGI